MEVAKTKIFKVVYKKKETFALVQQSGYYLEQVYIVDSMTKAFDVPCPVGFEVFSITELLEPKNLSMHINEKTIN